MNKIGPARVSPGFCHPANNYPGIELELFKKAVNWKNLVKNLLLPHLEGEILEVGAGIGGTTRILCTGEQKRWVCLEPDANLAQKIKSDIDTGILPGCCETRTGTIMQLNFKEKFDAILYIDVLEHIENDKQELDQVQRHIRPGGMLVILAPAHQFLFSPFDKAVGHYRRYNRAQLREIIPSSLFNHELKYLDCIGLFASLANKYFLKRKIPSTKQILRWDRTMVLISKKLDPIIKYTIGKSILGVWQKLHSVNSV